MKKIAGVFFSLVVCASVFSASNPRSVQTETGAKNKSQSKNGIPLWIKNPNSDYAERLYLIGVGSGMDDNSAEEDAKSDLIKTLNQTILSTENIKLYADSLTDNSTYTATISTSSEIQSISGLKIAEKYYAPDSKVYALAVLKRQDVSDYYARRIAKNSASVQEYLSFAKKNPGTIQSCIFAQNALNLGKENEYFSELIDVIDAPFPEDKTLSYGSFTQLSNEVAEIRKTVNVKIDVENDETDLIKNAFSECFAKAGIFSSNDEKSPYLLKAKITLEKTDTPDSKHVFYNYVLTADLTERNSKKILNSYAINGRAGHLNEQGAKNKVYVTLAKDVKNKYYTNLSDYFGITQ